MKPYYQLAENGGEYIDDTNAHTGQWVGFVVIAGAEIAAITQPGFTNEAALVGLALSEGSTVLGLTTSIELASGVVQMINRG